TPRFLRRRADDDAGGRGGAEAEALVRIVLRTRLPEAIRSHDDVARSGGGRQDPPSSPRESGPGPRLRRRPTFHRAGQAGTGGRRIRTLRATVEGRARRVPQSPGPCFVRTGRHARSPLPRGV